MIKLLIFDLDDTLYPEIDYVKSGFKAVTQFLQSKFNGDDDKYYQVMMEEFSKGNTARIVKSVLDSFEISYDQDLIMQLVNEYRQHHPQIKFPSKSANILDKLKKSYKLGLLTDGYLPSQKLKVKALNIEHYFEYIVYTEELGREYWKPSEKGFRLILEKSALKGQNCAYIADNPQKDFIAPNNLSFLTIQIDSPDKVHKIKPDSPSATPQHRINDISLLPDLLKSLNN
jgi:putative hydrolase of the HAD superfamily